MRDGAFQLPANRFSGALLESASGFPTTGATILPDVEVLPRSLQSWRRFLHWLGERLAADADEGRSGTSSPIDRALSSAVSGGIPQGDRDLFPIERASDALAAEHVRLKTEPSRTAPRALRGASVSRCKFVGGIVGARQTAG